MKGFCRANLEQVQREPSGDIADIDELTDMRRGLICTTPIFALIEWALLLCCSELEDLQAYKRTADTHLTLTCRMKWSITLL